MDLILQMLTNPDRVTENLVTFYGNPLAILLIHLIFFADEIYPFPGGLASHNSIRNTEDKVGKKKTGCKKEGKEREREISK